MTDGQSEACAANAAGPEPFDVLREIEIEDEGQWFPVTLAARGSDFVVVRYPNGSLNLVDSSRWAYALRNVPERRYKLWVAMCANGAAAMGDCRAAAIANALSVGVKVNGAARVVCVREIEWTNEARDDYAHECH